MHEVLDILNEKASPMERPVASAKPVFSHQLSILLMVLERFLQFFLLFPRALPAEKRDEK